MWTWEGGTPSHSGRCHGYCPVNGWEGQGITACSTLSEKKCYLPFYPLLPIPPHSWEVVLWCSRMLWFKNPPALCYGSKKKGSYSSFVFFPCILLPLSYMSCFYIMFWFFSIKLSFALLCVSYLGSFWDQTKPRFTLVMLLYQGRVSLDMLHHFQIYATWLFSLEAVTES